MTVLSSDVAVRPPLRSRSTGRPTPAALSTGWACCSQRVEKLLEDTQIKLSSVISDIFGVSEDHHGFLAQTMLSHIDALTTQIADVGNRIEAVIAPFSPLAARLDEITGVGVTAAQELIAEIGADVARFPDPAHLSTDACDAILATRA